METIINLKNVSHAYKSEFIQVEVLKNVNLSLEQGKFYSIMGPSGSGKTTLLNILGGLLSPTNGDVYIDGENITQYKMKALGKLRLEKIGFIFQNFNLIPFLTVKENIFLQMRISKRNVKEYKDRYEELVIQLGIKEKENSYIHELSGGQQQRVAIAR